MNKRHFPYVTIAFCGISLIIYAVGCYLTGSYQIDTDILGQLGAPNSIEIYQGKYWGLLSNAVVHAFPMHFGLNLLIFGLIGFPLEKYLGAMKYLVLLLVLNLLTSWGEHTFSDDPGLGLTGINFGLWSYSLAIRRQTTVITGFRFLLLNVLITCVVLIYFFNIIPHQYDIGKYAVLMGLGFGLLLGLINTWSKTIHVALFSLVTFVVYSSFVYAPYSANWNTYQGIEAQEQEKYQEAIHHYQRALEINEDMELATENLTLCRVGLLEDLAYQAHEQKNYLKARFYYEKILSIEPGNKWAAANLKNLP